MMTHVNIAQLKKHLYQIWRKKHLLGIKSSCKNSEADVHHLSIYHEVSNVYREIFYFIMKFRMYIMKFQGDIMKFSLWSNRRQYPLYPL